MEFLLNIACNLLAILRWYPEILLSLAFFFILRHFTARKSHIPTDWPLVGMLPRLLFNLHRIHELFTDILAETGCTILLKGPRFAGNDSLLTVDPANINHIFNTNYQNYPKGEEFIEMFDVLGNGIFNADGDSWRAQRRMAHTIMAEKRFRLFACVSTRRKLEEGFFPLLDEALREKDDGQAVVDLHNLFSRFSFDTTCMLIIGKDPRCLSAGLPRNEFAEAIDTVEEVLLFRHLVPKTIRRLVRWLRLGEEARMASAWVTIDNFIYGCVAERREELSKTSEDKLRCGHLRKFSSGTPRGDGEVEGGSSPDMLTSYLYGNGMVDEKMPNSIDFRSSSFLRDTILNLMVAGRDTTSAALSWFFHLISIHSQAEARILQELHSGHHAHSQSDIGPVFFETDELARLVYLHAALLETLRLYPSVPLEHKAPLVPDTLPSGHAVHPGLKVVVSLYAMGRVKGVWGEDAAEFRPERWINEGGRLRHEPSYKYLAFNSGPRTCLGKDVAMNQMKAVAAALIYNYEFKPVPGSRVEPKTSIILHMKYGLKTAVARREAWPKK